MKRLDNLYAHGFVRAALCCPAVSPGDPAANLTAILELAKRAHEGDAALALFPELSISGYAIDDLLLQTTLLDAVEAALAELTAKSAKLAPLILVGAPLRRGGALHNCAVAIQRGQILGVVAKTYLPNYREYYEKRHFGAGDETEPGEIMVAGRSVPFGVELVFAAEDLPDFVVGVEICEDMWAVAPPSGRAAMAGATILCNLSGSPITIGKARERATLCDAQSRRAIAAYLYAAAGLGESTTDLSWDGQLSAYEYGDLLGETERFAEGGRLLVVDIDTERLVQERRRMGTFRDSAARADLSGFRTIPFRADPADKPLALQREVARFPYAPSDPAKLDQDCYEAYNIQVSGLATRMRATGLKRAVIGVSGGLDSTQALLVIAKTFDRLGLPRKNILAVTMPGFATSDGTKSQAWDLMRSLGVDAREVDIKPLARQLLSDLGHPANEGKEVYDITYENVQAGLRTDFLFRLANQEGGIVIGTGDMSELALGWCTYGVGDHMSHYGVNGGLPKTLIQHLIRWSIATKQYDAATEGVLERILATEISPELVPGVEVQSTQARIGPYALQDFNLFYTLRWGFKPSKIAFLADHAWTDASKGSWPPNLPAEDMRAFSRAEIVKWMEEFLKRFFTTSQFKRSALPNGPKISPGGALSPRGDWRAPSDGNARAWLADLARIRKAWGL